MSTTEAAVPPVSTPGPPDHAIARDRETPTPLPPNNAAAPLSKQSDPPEFAPPARPEGAFKNQSETKPVLKTSILDDFLFVTFIDLSASPTHAQEISNTGQLPTWVQKCTNLQFLIACNLGLTHIDEWVSTSLLQLRVLRVSDNELLTWPSHLARLLPYDQITVVDLEGNPCFMNFCARCPSFAADYAKAAGLVSPRKGLRRSSERKKSSASRRDSMASLKPAATTSTSLPEKKKSGFFFRRRKESIIQEESAATTSIAQNQNDESSDDEMLTSLNPVAPSLLEKGSKSRSLSVSSIASPDTPDTWAQKRIEESEIDKTRVLLNHLRDTWEMSTQEIIKPDPALRAAAAMQRSLSISTSASPTALRSPVSPRASFSNGKGAQTPATTLKNNIHTHSRLNSLEVLEQYLDDDDMDMEMPKVSPPDRTQVIRLLTRIIEDEKNYVARLGEFLSIYVNSKKRPAAVSRIFASIPSLYQLHSNIMMSALQRCLDSYVSRTDPNMDRLAEVILLHVHEFKAYIDYEIILEESMRLVVFFKRITALETNQPANGAMPSFTAYKPADPQVADWIQSCLANKAHKLNGITDYLQLPIDQLERYRLVLRKFSTITPKLETAYSKFDEICAHIELEKPKVAQQRRLAEFDKVYNFASSLAPRDAILPARRYYGDAVVLLNTEVKFEQPTPDSSRAADTLLKSSQEPSIPKVVSRIIYKSKFSLALYRIIVCDDVVLVASEEKKKLVKVIDRRLMSTTLPWKYSVREGLDAFPTGDLVSVRSRSSSLSSTTSPTPGSGSGAGAGSQAQAQTPGNSVRFVFHDEPAVWHCTLKAFTGGRKSNYKEPRARMVELFQS